MDGPWEKYAAPSSAAGPWTKYGGTASAPATPAIATDPPARLSPPKPAWWPSDEEWPPRSHLLGETGAAARGAIAGVIGAPGDVEWLARRPYAALASEFPSVEKVLGKPADTILPTTSDVEKWLPGTGVGRKHPVYQTAGELATPALAVKGAEAAKAAPEVVEDAAKVASRVLPGATSRAQALVSEIGTPTDESVLGRKMYRDLKERVDGLLKTRSQTASAMKKQYRVAGMAKEKEIGDAYRDFLYQTAAEKSRDLSPALKGEIQKSLDNLGDDPSIDALVTERRRLMDLAHDRNEADTTKKTFLGDMAHALDRLMAQKVPEYQAFNEKYAEMSRDINLFEDTALGKRVTKETSEHLPDVPAYDPATLPKTFFKTKDSVAALRRLSGGNDKFVSDAAGEYAASELKGLSTEASRSWLEKNRIWLDEVPEVKADVEKYVTNLEAVSHTQETAKNIAVGTGLAGGYYGLRHFLGW
jgi:hypothetical protein